MFLKVNLGTGGHQFELKCFDIAYIIFILVHISTSLEECERRDRKGLYAQARKGTIKEFTGVSVPYEIPTKAEIVINTEGRKIDDCCNEVLTYLEEMNYLRLDH